MLNYSHFDVQGNIVMGVILDYNIVFDCYNLDEKVYAQPSRLILFYLRF